MVVINSTKNETSANMDFECRYCQKKCSSGRNLQQHVLQLHPAEKAFRCNNCPTAFKNQSSLQRHGRSCSIKLTDKQLNKAPIALDEYPVVFGETPNFESWHTKYLANKTEYCRDLCKDTACKIIQFIGSSLGSFESFFDAMDFDEYVDCYLDTKQSELKPSTLTKHLRYIRWFLLWKYSNHECCSSLFPVIDVQIQNSQALASTRDQHVSLLNFLSPYKLIAIREKVVLALRKYQVETIDPFVVEFLQSAQPHKLMTFTKKLRNWLELCLRFINVPLRIQCSINMVMSDAENDDYKAVCKLDKLPTGYTRIVIRDKVQQSHQPVHINVPDVLNPYIHFYLIHCRTANENSNFVFLNKTGGPWTKASKQLKRFMETDLGVNANDIEPSGRFIHCTRKIALAAFGTVVDFDVEKMKGFARLMRHSLATSEAYYGHWVDTKLSQSAVKNWNSSMLGQVDSDPVCVYKPGNIRTPPNSVSAWFRASFSFHKTDTSYTLCDAATQTNWDETMQQNQHQNSKSTLPLCTTCFEKFSVFGPYGLARDTEHFGRYFAQCKKCHDHGRPTKCHTVWFELGATPVEKSVSNKNRNQQTIDEHIQRHKKKHKSKLA
jgi:hypothetical protein